MWYCAAHESPASDGPVALCYWRLGMGCRSHVGVGVVGAVVADRVARYVELIERPDTLDVIAQRVADGEGLPALCKSWDVPYGRVMMWLMSDLSRYEVYKRALEVGAHLMVVEAISIADEQQEVVREDGSKFDPDVQRDKLRVDTRLKVARSHARELYGEQRKVTHEVVGDFGERLRRARERVVEGEVQRVSGPVKPDDEVVL